MDNFLSGHFRTHILSNIIFGSVCMSHFLIVRHICSSHMFVTYVCHICLSHTFVTYVCHTYSANMGGAEEVRRY